MSPLSPQPNPDYLDHWSLKYPPFLGNPDFFFSGQPQRETLAALQYFAASSWKLAFLTAVSQSGVTHLLDHLVSMRGLGDCPIDVILTQGSSDHSSSIHQLGAAYSVDGDTDIEVIRHKIDAAIRQSDREGIRTLWLIEKCTVSNMSIASDLARKHRNFSVVATTQPDERTALQLSAGMCGMQIQLNQFCLQDTADYVETALRHAGGEQRIFSEASTARLHELSVGVIGDAAVIAESALTAAACRSLPMITPDIIDLVYEIHRQWRSGRHGYHRESLASMSA